MFARFYEMFYLSGGTALMIATAELKYSYFND